eukprot:767003-Amphidinium_carterae.1
MSLGGSNFYAMTVIDYLDAFWGTSSIGVLKQTKGLGADDLTVQRNGLPDCWSFARFVAVFGANESAIGL